MIAPRTEKIKIKTLQPVQNAKHAIKCMNHDLVKIRSVQLSTLQVIYPVHGAYHLTTNNKN